MTMRMGWLAGLFLSLALVGCSDSSSAAGGSGGSAGSAGSGGESGAGGGGTDTRLVVTADWLNKSLTLFDYAKLIDGESSATDARLRTIDLGAFEPGPLEVEITPDGKSALVAVGPGFFDGDGVANGLIGSPEVPPGGAMLIVDLDTGEAVEVETAHVPMGIAISADGLVAYTANYGTIDEPGNTMSIIDIERAAVIEEITLGGRPEQVVLSPDGTLGAINLAGANGGVHVFETADAAATLSALVATGNDPSDVTFLADESRVVVANSFGLDVSLVDTSDPSAPELIGNFPVGGGFPYGVTYMPSRDQILAPAGTGANLVTIDVDGDTLLPANPQALPGGAFPLTAAVDGRDSFAFVAHIADKTLSVVDVETGAIRALTWLDGPGPSYAAVQP